MKKKFSIFIAASAAMSAMLIPSASAEVHKMRVIFSGYNAPERSESLYDFPALIKFENGIGGSGFNFESMPFESEHALDLRFHDENEMELPYEIDTYIKDSLLLVWVKVPEIRPDGGSYIIASWAS